MDALDKIIEANREMLDEKNARIAELQAQVESLQNRWATRPLSSEDQGRRIVELEAALREIADADPSPTQLETWGRWAMNKAFDTLNPTASETDCYHEWVSSSMMGHETCVKCHRYRPTPKTCAECGGSGLSMQPTMPDGEPGGLPCTRCRKQFAPIGNGTICSNCTKTVAYHYQTAEGYRFCYEPKVDADIADHICIGKPPF